MTERCRSDEQRKRVMDDWTPRHPIYVPPVPAPPRDPVNAATLIIVDRSERTPKVLLGRRHQKHVFLPGKLVFPGGRVEPSDRAMPVAAGFDPQVEARLRNQIDPSRPAEPVAFGLAAIRETFEETGLLLGAERKDAPAVPDGWSDFIKAGYYPDLSVLHFIARAITPPGFPRRFDARFFAADIGAVAHRIKDVVHADAELVELTWVTVAQAQELELADITLIVLDDLEERIASGFGHDRPVPFYQMRGSRFTREWL